MPERMSGITGNEDQSEGTTTSPLAGTSSAPIPGQGRSMPGGGNGGGSKTKSFEKTGETVIIPVGTEIISVSNPEMKFDIGNLSKGMNLMVFVDDELTEKEKIANPDSNVVYSDSVRILQTQ